MNRHLKLFGLLSLISLGNAGAMIKLKDFTCPPGQHSVDTDMWAHLRRLKAGGQIGPQPPRPLRTQVRTMAAGVERRRPPI